MTWYRPNAKAPPPTHGNQPPVLPLNVTPPQATTPWAAIKRTTPTPASIIEFDLVIVMTFNFCRCSSSLSHSPPAQFRSPCRTESQTNRVRGLCSRLGAQQGDVTVGEVRAARQELRDRGELVGIETLQQRGHIFSYGAEHVLDVSHPVEHWGEDLP